MQHSPNKYHIPISSNTLHGLFWKQADPVWNQPGEFPQNPEAVLEEPRKKGISDGWWKTDFKKRCYHLPRLCQSLVLNGEMSIDLNTCKVAVLAWLPVRQNNVPVVGKTQVQRNITKCTGCVSTVISPVIKTRMLYFSRCFCQHCDNAPQWNRLFWLQPTTAAKVEQMTYNRCIGTRYCANNCPYKVRRFNWLDYTGADSSPITRNRLLGVDMDESVFQMNDDLTRMVLNPDVTVRSRVLLKMLFLCSAFAG